MPLFNPYEVLETLHMIEAEKLDIRTITMGISLRDCADHDGATRAAAHLRQDHALRRAAGGGGEEIEQRIRHPHHQQAHLRDADRAGGRCVRGRRLRRLRRDAGRARRAAVGVNFIGGFSALVHKGYTAGDQRLIRSIPEALAGTERVCASVNVATTRAGINMDAVREMGEIIMRDGRAAPPTADGIGCAKLVVFANAAEDNPFMAGAFHGVGRAGVRHQRRRQRPRRGQERAGAGARARTSAWWPRRSSGPPSRSRAWASWSRRRPRGGWACPSASSTCRWRPPPRWATAWRTSWRRWAWSAAARRAPRPRWRCSTTR